MANIRITKEFTFETGHALYGHDGLCKNVHGHSYVGGYSRELPRGCHPSQKWNAHRFFGSKGNSEAPLVDVFDHATVLNIKSPHKKLADEMESMGHKVVR